MSGAQPTLFPVFRDFPPSVETLAAQWRTALNIDSWVPIAGQVTQTEAAAFLVRNGQTSGFAKPGHVRVSVQDHPRAAHEKIAADLAFELKLPVPPVVLWNRRNAPAGQERHCCVSAIPFEGAFYTWRQIRTRAGIAVRIGSHLGQVASAMSVFDTWIMNGDRFNDGNLLIQQLHPNGPVRAAYIDLANSMTLVSRFLQHQHPGQTLEEQWRKSYVIQRYPQEAPQDDSARDAAVARIEALPDSVIHDIVTRIPIGYMDAAKQAEIVAGLIFRKQHLRGMLVPPP